MAGKRRRKRSKAGPRALQKAALELLGEAIASKRLSGAPLVAAVKELNRMIGFAAKPKRENTVVTVALPFLKESDDLPEPAADDADATPPAPQVQSPSSDRPAIAGPCTTTP